MPVQHAKGVVEEIRLLALLSLDPGPTEIEPLSNRGDGLIGADQPNSNLFGRGVFTQIERTIPHDPVADVDMRAAVAKLKLRFVKKR